MSHPPHGPPPPYYTGHGHPPPPPGGSYTYVPTPVMMPVYQPPPPQPPPPDPAQPTYVTNYIYQQPPQPTPVTIVEEVHVQPAPPPNKHWSSLMLEGAGKGLTTVSKGLAVRRNLRHGNANPITWVPTTTSEVSSLKHRAYVAGREAWDGSPLCVIRAHQGGELLPGKLAIKHRSAYVPNGGREIPIHNFEVLCCASHTVRWLHSSNGQVPAGAIAAGNTHTGEPLYIGRVSHQNSLTPGKVHPSHGCCYISFGGAEHKHNTYEVLCRFVG